MRADATGVREKRWVVREMCADDATRAREEAEECDGVVRIDGWMARIKESESLLLSFPVAACALACSVCTGKSAPRVAPALLRNPPPRPKREKLEALVLAAHPPVRLKSSHTTHTAMATTKIQTPLSLLRASAPLGRSVHTSILHAARPSPASSSALILSRHASSAASTSTTPTQSQTPQLTWDEFLKLRRTRRFINLGSSALSGAASIGVAVPAFAEFEIENIGAQMTGLDPMFIIGGSLMGVGAVGWLLGPFLGTTFFNIWKGSVRKEFARVCYDPARSHLGTLY